MQLRDARIWVGLLVAVVLLFGCQAETDFDTTPAGGTETTQGGTATTSEGY
jgi:hypothetical protein